MIIERIFSDRKRRFGQSVTQFYLNKKVFMDHQLTGVFTKVEEVRYISGI